jgi:hypothetical protein
MRGDTTNIPSVVLYPDPNATDLWWDPTKRMHPSERLTSYMKDQKNVSVFAVFCASNLYTHDHSLPHL